MTARERARTLMDIPELWTLPSRISDVTMDAMLNWAEAAILDHAEAVREEDAKMVEAWPTECNCSAPDIGVGVLHEPGCGLPQPKEVAAIIRSIKVT